MMFTRERLGWHHRSPGAEVRPRTLSGWEAGALARPLVMPPVPDKAA